MADTVQLKLGNLPPLKGRWLLLIRLACLGMVVLALLVLVAGTIAFINAGCVPAIQCGLSTMQSQMLGTVGLSLKNYAIVIAASAWLIMTVVLGGQSWLLSRFPEDWFILLASTVFVVFTVLLQPMTLYLPDHDPRWLPAIMLLSGGALRGGIAVLYIYPNGRFAPKWTRFIMWGWVATLPLILVSQQNLIVFWSLPLSTVLNIAALVLTTGGLAGQGSRLINFSTKIEHQQSRWLLAAFSLASIVYAGGVLFQQVSQPEEIAIVGLITMPFTTLPLLVIPAIFGVAMLRERLWEVDLYVNRALIYGTLAIILSGIFTLSVLLLNLIIEQAGLSDFSVWSASIAAIFVMAIYRPLYGYLKSFVDRYFYGVGIDYSFARRLVLNLEILKNQPEVLTSFGQFTEMTLIGQGGMGQVYLVKIPDGLAALKILPKYYHGSKVAVKRFMREATTVSLLNHHHIVELYDFGEVDDTPYMLLEYIDGEDLKEVLIAQGRLPFKLAVKHLRDIAEAVDYAHENGVVHRDIKPSNIMIQSSRGITGKRYRAVLMDFGIARINKPTSPLTEGTVLGTLDYMAPEQIVASSDVDGRADIYSLGVLFYVMLTGEPPFDYELPNLIITAHKSKPPPDPRIIVPRLSPQVSKVIRKAMSKKPEDRYRTAKEMVLDLSHRSATS